MHSTSGCTGKDNLRSLHFLLRILVCSALVCLGISTSAQLSRKTPYVWKQVQIVGGGFVDGIVFDPTVAGILYARTDIGGAYRWDSDTRRWQPLMDWVSYRDWNLMGVESIAIDPSDPNRLYIACGMYTSPSAPDGAILRSNNRGRTFQRTDLPFKLGGNEDGRGNGERLAVDPRDGRILYLGTRHDGLWRSEDRGATWRHVESFPRVAEVPVVEGSDVSASHPRQRWPVHGDGIVFVKFDPAETAKGSKSPTQTIYVGVSLMNRPNLFVTHDGGATWSAITGEPTQYRPTRAALGSNGILYIAYGTAPGPSRMTNGAVWKLNTQGGSWSDITPERPEAGKKEFGYAAVSVDAHHPRTLIVSTFGRPRSEGGDNIFRSTNGGATWKPIFGGPDGGVFDYSLAPYVKKTPIHWLFDIEIDPTNSNHAVFTTGYGGWETYDLADADDGKPTHWSILAKGIEETVALALDSPTQGAHLISGIGDYGGFVHWNLDRPAVVGSSAPPRMANTTALASAALNPAVIVRVGISARHKAGGNIGYSLDGGRTWHRTLAAPETQSRAGSIAVSTNGNTWLWTPYGEPAFVTHDRGAKWIQAQGLPAGLKVIADPKLPTVFYAVSISSHTLYQSVDGGATFTACPFALSDDPPAAGENPRGDPRGGQNRIYATPGRSADLWLPAGDGLFHLSSLEKGPGTLQFNRLQAVERIQAFGFGKAAPHHNYPALYLAGTIRGEAGVFRSLDEGQNWTRINDNAHKWGIILQITGDPRIFGRVYVGTHGRGILYGDPASVSVPRP